MQPILRPLWSDFHYKEHQEVGVQWMLQREKLGDGGILCDEMGLGKTIQMVSLIKHAAKGPREETLLVAPVAVLGQWKSVLKRAGMSVYIPAKSGVSWVLEGTNTSQLAPHIHVIGYEAALRKTVLVKAYKWARVIYDEAHRLASNNSNAKLATVLKRRYMWLLTATPIINKLKDLLNLLTIVGVELPPTNDIHTLEPIIKDYVMARTMEQLRPTNPDIPAKADIHLCDMEFLTEDEREFYQGMTGHITRRWKAIEADGSPGAALEKLKLFMRLRQLSLHPQVYIAARKSALKGLYTRQDWEGTSTKFEAIRNLVTNNTVTHKWIVFCHFRLEMEMLSNILKAETVVDIVQQYHGGLSAAQKQDVIERTHLPVAEGKQEVLLVQLQSGGVGLNLQHFDNVIFTGPWWTNALMEQAIGRAVRIGQKRQVNVYILRLKEETTLNIDAYMLQKANEKGDLCKRVLGHANQTVSLCRESDASSRSV